MNISYYTIDDLCLPPKRALRKGWTMEPFPTLDEALERYRALPPSGIKSLGLTDGTHALEAVRCLPLFPDDTEGENVLASDYRKFLLWAQQPEAKAAEKRCITELGLRYALQGKMIAPIPPSEELSDDLMDKYLWLNVGGELQSAIRQIYVAGMGWVSPAALNRLSSLPLVLKYRVDGVTEQGAYLSLEIEPWEYEPLVRQTENHFDLERKSEQ